MSDDEKLMLFWKTLCVLSKDEPCEVSWKFDGGGATIFRIYFRQYVDVTGDRYMAMDQETADYEVTNIDLNPVNFAKLKFNRILAEWQGEVKRRVGAMI